MVKMNDDVREICNKISQFKFKNTMLKFYLRDVCDVYILVKGGIRITDPATPWAGAAATWAEESSKQVKFKTCALFTDCISEINNTLVDNVKDLEVMIAI